MQESAIGTGSNPVPCGVSVGSDAVKLLPVAATLRGLEIGQSITFPIEQRSTVLNTITRFRSDYSRSGWDVITQTNRQQFNVVVTRVS